MQRSSHENGTAGKLTAPQHFNGVVVKCSRQRDGEALEASTVKPEWVPEECLTTGMQLFPDTLDYSSLSGQTAKEEASHLSDLSRHKLTDSQLTAGARKISYTTSSRRHTRQFFHSATSRSCSNHRTSTAPSFRRRQAAGEQQAGSLFISSSPCRSTSTLQHPRCAVTQQRELSGCWV